MKKQQNYCNWLNNIIEVFEQEFNDFYEKKIDFYPELVNHIDILYQVKRELKNISNDVNWDKELKEELIQVLKTMCELVLDDELNICLYTFLQLLKQYLPKHFWWIDVDSSFLALTQILIPKDMIMDVLVGID